MMKKLKSHKISKLVMVTMFVIIALVFVPAMTFVEDDMSGYTVDVMLGMIYLLMLAAVALISAGVVMSARKKLSSLGPKGEDKNGLPGGRITAGVIATALIAGTCGLIVALTDSTKVKVNGAVCNDNSSMMLADIFIYGAIAMIVIAAAAVAINASGILRGKTGRRNFKVNNEGKA